MKPKSPPKRNPKPKEAGIKGMLPDIGEKTFTPFPTTNFINEEGKWIISFDEETIRKIKERFMKANIGFTKTIFIKGDKNNNNLFKDID